MRSASILARAMVYGAILTIAIAGIGSILGYAVAGVPGLVSALIGSGLTALFMALTALSIVLAARVSHNEATSTLFFGVVLGVWLLKFIVFIVIMVVLRGQSFIQPVVLFVAILAAVIGSLAVDVLAFVRSRVPYTTELRPAVEPHPIADDDAGVERLPIS